MWGKMGCWSGEMGRVRWGRLGRLAVLGESGWVDAPPHLQKKNRGGLHPTTLVPAFLSLHLPYQK